MRKCKKYPCPVDWLALYQICITFIHNNISLLPILPILFHWKRQTVDATMNKLVLKYDLCKVLLYQYIAWTVKNYVSKRSNYNKDFCRNPNTFYLCREARLRCSNQSHRIEFLTIVSLPQSAKFLHTGCFDDWMFILVVFPHFSSTTIRIYSPNSFLSIRWLYTILWVITPSI